MCEIFSNVKITVEIINVWETSSYTCRKCIGATINSCGLYCTEERLGGGIYVFVVIICRTFITYQFFRLKACGRFQSLAHTPAYFHIQQFWFVLRHLSRTIEGSK